MNEVPRLGGGFLMVVRDDIGTLEHYFFLFFFNVILKTLGKGEAGHTVGVLPKLTDL